MLAVRFPAPEQAAVAEVPRPELQDTTDAILMVTTTAIGPWDLYAYRAGLRGITPGAQFAGIVVETGTDVQSVSIDDLVVCAIAVPGELAHTPFGTTALPGGHAEYVRVPDADRMLVKTTPAAEERTVLTGGAVALGIAAAEKALALPDAQLVMAWGCDAAVMSALAWLKRRSGGTVKAVAFDHHAGRATAAKQFGAERVSVDDLPGIHPDVVLAGRPAHGPSLEELAPCLRAGATVIHTDPANTDLKTPPLPTGVEAIFCEWPSQEQVRRAALAVQLRQIDLTLLVSHVIPLDQAEQAYQQAADAPPGTQTVLLKP